MGTLPPVKVYQAYWDGARFSMIEGELVQFKRNPVVLVEDQTAEHGVAIYDGNEGWHATPEMAVWRVSDKIMLALKVKLRAGAEAAGYKIDMLKS